MEVETESTRKHKQAIEDNLKLLASTYVLWRKERKMSQEKLSEVTGISPQAISKIENCESDPRLSTLIASAEGFGISMSKLFQFGLAPIYPLLEPIEKSPWKIYVSPSHIRCPFQEIPHTCIFVRILNENPSLRDGNDA